MARFTEQELRKEGFDSKTIWHGVDHTQFKPVNKEMKTFIRKKHGFKEDDIILFNYGRNSPRKNNQTLIKAAALACLKNPKIKAYFHIIKNNDISVCHVNDYVSRILKLELGVDLLNKQLFFTDGTGKSDTDIVEMVQMSDVCISANIGEGFGIINAESMACAVPIISNKYTTGGELIEDIYDDEIGPRGLTIKPVLLNTSSFNVTHGFIKPEDLANTIISFLSSQEYKNNMFGKNGRKFVEKYLTWDTIAKQFDDTFTELV